MAIDIKLVKTLRDETQASIADCKKALDESNGDYEKAVVWLRKKGIERAEKKADRETAEGLIESYVHGNGKIGVIVALLCETDFVARTDEFKKLAHEIAMQISAMDPKDVKELLAQEYIRDSKVTIEEMVKQAIGKLGENIVIREFKRFQL